MNEETSPSNRNVKIKFPQLLRESLDDDLDFLPLRFLLFLLDDTSYIRLLFVIDAVEIVYIQ